MDDQLNLSGMETGSTNIYFTLFKRNIPWDFGALIALRWLIGMVSCVLNIGLFYVVVKTQFLYGTCNFLIGFNALCAAISNPFLTIGLVIVLAQIGFIYIWNCFWIQLIPMISGNLFMASMLAIGVDRLLSVCCSLWHSRQNRFAYLTGIVSICFCYAFVVVYLCFIGVQSHQNYVVLCANPGETYQGDIGNVLFRMNLSIISLTIFCYLVLWLLLHTKKVEVNGNFTQKILKSLLCMVLVITLGYFLSSSIRIVAPYVSLSQFAYFAFIASIFSVAAMGANGPILYCFSYDYRKAIRKQFPRIFPTNQNVSTSNMMGITRIAPAGSNRQFQQHIAVS